MMSGITAENIRKSRHVRPDMRHVTCVSWMTSRFIADMTWRQTLARHCVTYRMNNTYVRRRRRSLKSQSLVPLLLCGVHIFPREIILYLRAIVCVCVCLCARARTCVCVRCKILERNFIMQANTLNNCFLFFVVSVRNGRRKESGNKVEAYFFFKVNVGRHETYWHKQMQTRSSLFRCHDHAGWFDEERDESKSFVVNLEYLQNYSSFHGHCITFCFRNGEKPTGGRSLWSERCVVNCCWYSYW